MLLSPGEKKKHTTTLIPSQPPMPCNANLLQMETQQAALVRHMLKFRSSLPLPETIGSASLRTGIGLLFAHRKVSKIRFLTATSFAACPDLFPEKVYLYFKDHIHSNRYWHFRENQKKHQFSIQLDLRCHFLLPYTLPL